MNGRGSIKCVPCVGKREVCAVGNSEVACAREGAVLGDGSSRVVGKLGIGFLREQQKSANDGE